jgi:hypothetical protein
MNLLALDVSSTAAGYATFPAGRLDRFGVVRPRGRLVHNTDRIDLIVDTLRSIAAEVGPDVICLEWSDGYVAGRLKQGGAAGLSVLGAAQGAAREALRRDGHKVECVGETLWTKRRPKAERAARVALEFPEYAAFKDAGKDVGMDAGDAIGIGLYFLARHKIELLVAAAKGGGS